MATNDTSKIQVRPDSDTMDPFADSTTAVADQIRSAISAHPVVVFVKENCPFCLEVQQTFASLNVACKTYDLPSMARGAEVRSALKASTGQSTVPYVYINKEFIGGCDATKKLQTEGKLQTQLLALGLLQPPALTAAPEDKPATAQKMQHDTADMQVPVAVTGKAGVSKKRASGTLFGFPNTVDSRTARLNGVLTFIICVFVAVFFRKGAAHWTMLGVLVDFVLRFLFGHSPIAAMSQLICAIMELFGSKPKWISGPPKQFAALCGTMFSGCATFFFLTMGHERNLEYVGLAFTCALAMATGLEGFLDFCLGCVFFGYMIDFGLMPNDVYTTHLNSQFEVAYAWEDANKIVGDGPPQIHTHNLDPEQPLVVDLRYKAKTDDMTREDFHMIKHVKMTHWSMHLGCVALAAAWKFAANEATLGASRFVWYTLGIASAVWYAVFALLYIAKMVLYCPKVMKEWHCPLRGNSFAMPFICLMLYAYLIETWTHTFAVVLFWAGAGPTMLLSIMKVGDWIAFRYDIEFVDASWMIMPVGNFVAAFVGPILDEQYTSAMQFFFAFAFMLWALLFALTFYKAVVHIDNDDRRRPLLAIWIAAPAVAAMAYLTCFALPARMVGTDFVFTNLYWFSVALSLIFLWCFVRPFLGRIKFDMSYWAGGFPLAILAVVSTQYAMMQRGKLSMGIAYTTLAAASALIGTLLLNTLSATLRRKVFVPDVKWSPISFMKLTHEAIREAATELFSIVDSLHSLLHQPTQSMDVDNLKAMDQSSKSSNVQMKSTDRSAARALLLSLASQWADLEFVHSVHSFQEDSVIFTVFEQYFPGVAEEASSEHSEFNAASEHIATLIAELLTACSDESKAVRPGTWKDLNYDVRATLHSLLDHLRHEEDHLQPVPRKHLPLAVHKQIAVGVWEGTPATAWFKLLPWVINHLPMTQQRIRFLKTFLWALPERAQQMGVMLAAGTDPTTFRLLTDELPELIPRGADGWRRQH